uniref:ATP synthase F0 subunit 8 n=1 Tax=Gelidiella flabella TaxID=2026927 RepID=A0A7G9IW87_9FLOR|nr:ATP synthase F0 subunit 8 [Gelidiella flabella]QNM39631.1 ATP synthase F0 subunit 8 [Gelidiella flabella]
MPQLDRIIIFPQIFWLFLIFTLFYTILTHFFLPKFLRSLKARKLIAKANSEKVSLIVKESAENKIKLTNTVMHNLTAVTKILNNSSTLNISNFNLAKIGKVDEAIGIATKNSILFCNSQILDSINIYFKLIKK